MKHVMVSLVGVMMAAGQAGDGQGVSASNTPVLNSVPARLHRPVRPPRVQPKPAVRNRQGVVTNAKPKTVRPPTINYADALRRARHERHDRIWWKSHYTTIIFVTGGYYYWDAGYWFPAWGDDPVYDVYDYDGPIYTYGNLLPDQVVLNAQ